MHLPLDEYSETDLEGELGRRYRLQQRGLCDYCERPYDTKACKFPERHKWIPKVESISNPWKYGEIALKTPTTESIVHEALDNALENGYNMLEWSLHNIVTDLMCFEANLENHTMSSLLPHIESWRAKNNMNGERI